MSYILNAPLIRKSGLQETEPSLSFLFVLGLPFSHLHVFLTVPFLELLYWGPLPRTLARLITVWAVGVASLQLFLSWGTSCSPFLWVQCAPASLQQPVMSGKSGSRDRFRARNWECYSVGAQKTLARKERVTPTLPLACCVTQANFLSWVGKKDSGSLIVPLVYSWECKVSGLEELGL